jgi:glutamyl-tRNA synthetase
MNGNYIRALSPADLEAKLCEFLASEEPQAYFTKPESESAPMLADLALLKTAFDEHRAYAMSAVLLEQERVVTLADFGPATAFFFQDQPPMDQKAIDKWFGESHVPAMFDYLIDALPEEVSVEACEVIVREYAQGLGLEKLGPVVHPIRVALTGKTVGPGLFELMAVLGTDRMVKRLTYAKGLLK